MTKLPSPLVSAEWLSANLDASQDAGRLVVLDASFHLPAAARDPAAEFAAAHIPGARFLGLANLFDAASPVPYAFPTPDQLAERLASLGVTATDAIVVYDDSAIRTAARAWFVLTASGRENVAILDGGQSAAPDLADLHLSLDITTATRSVMMFTVHYRLNIANRSARAVADTRVAVQMVCARASANSPGANAASVGAEQALGETPRIGPHQARSIIGEVQMPLSAIQPLRQGTTPLFVPLIHVTIEAEGQPALTRTFVIGTPSASGRVHPIQLDQPPGGIAGLVAQAVAVPAGSDVSAAA